VWYRKNIKKEATQQEKKRKKCIPQAEGKKEAKKYTCHKQEAKKNTEKSQIPTIDLA